jgi:HK97 family phage prohead protease
VLWDDIGIVDGRPERFAPFAFADFLDSPLARSVRLLRSHHEPVTLARASDRSLRLWQDNAGLAFSCPLDGPRLGLIHDVLRGGYVGMSPSWTRTRTRVDDGVIVTVRARLYEVSVTDDPAFEQARIWLSSTDYYDLPAHVQEQHRWWSRRDDSWRKYHVKAERPARRPGARWASDELAQGDVPPPSGGKYS